MSSWSEKAAALESFPRGTFAYPARAPLGQNGDVPPYNLREKPIFTTNLNYSFFDLRDVKELQLFREKQ